MEQAYRDDLAHIHDAGFGHFARGAAGVLLEELRARQVDGGLVIDLACGSGLLSEQLAAAGFDVLGIDLSPAFIALARQRVPRGAFRVESLLTAELPPCVGVAAVGECFNYLFDNGHSWMAVRQVLTRVFAALLPGGSLVFDIAEPGRGPAPGANKSWVEGDGWAVLVHTEEDRAQSLLTRRITSFRQIGDWYRRDFEVHRLRLLRRGEMVSWLQDVGFEVRVLDSYGNVPFAPGHVGFLARKP
jgi:SAM-dependent methyltransferase